MARAPAPRRTFHQELVLHRWLLGFFKGRTLAALKARLGDDRHEGIDEDGQTRFFHELTRNLFEVDRISEADLRRFDLNIVRHWQAITERRNRNGAQLEMKYLPVPVFAAHRNLSGFLFQASSGADQRPQRRAENLSCRARRRGFPRLRRGRPEQGRLLERHRQRQDAPPACEHPAVPGVFFGRQARRAPGQDHPADTE